MVNQNAMHSILNLLNEFVYIDSSLKSNKFSHLDILISN